jgi:cytochrome c-type biogenesis protein CcmF
MASIIGFALLLLIFSINIFLAVFSFFSLRKITNFNQIQKDCDLEKISFALTAVSFFCAITSQLCLIYSFVISDYSVVNVYQNSHHLKPLIYKISGSWGNHEGSMLLLLVIISGYSFAFNLLSKIDAGNKIIITASQSLILALFAAFTAFTSNPFAQIFPTPLEGLGLNPVLQDIGLAMHPPMLYTGYIGFSLIFSFAIGGFLTEKIDKKFAHYLKGWLFFAYGFLTLGIGLGAWWAYRELGWGGYWFWDPVENVSLMPWIAATALIHCIMLLEKKELCKIWSGFLAMLTFILCLMGIFLVRSGILTSVHSFAIDTSRGFFVIALITIIGGFGMVILGIKSSKIKSEKHQIVFWSKIGSILLNNYFLIISLFIVLLGTVYPIFSRSFFDQFVSIGPDYYNKIFSILIIPFLFFLGISNWLNYESKSHKGHFFNWRNLATLLVSIALTSLTFLYHTKIEPSQIIILFLAIFIVVTTLRFTPYALHLPMQFAHLGFCLVIIGIILTSSFGLIKETNLKEGESTKVGRFEIKFEKIEHLAGENFIARQGSFVILENEKNIGTTSPQLRYYPVSEQTTNEASIEHQIFGDLYTVIGNKDDTNNYAIRIYYKPFIYLIWLGCLFIFGASMLKILLKKYEK